MDDKTIVCRCSDVTVGEIRAAIKKGYTTFEELKRVIRVGMGPCHGRTCMPLVLRELSIATGEPIENFKPGKKRPPCNHVTLGAIADQEGDSHE